MTQPILDLTKLTPAQIAQLQRILTLGMPTEEPTGPDLTRVPIVMICHNRRNPHAYLETDIAALDVKRPVSERGKCPDCGASMGFAPVAINDIVIAFEDHAALRAGDTATHTKYAPVVDDPLAGEAPSNDDTEAVVTTTAVKENQ